MSKQPYDQLAMNLVALLLHDPKNFRDPRLSKDMFPEPLDSVFDIAISLYREGVKPTPEAIGVYKHPNASEASKHAAQILGRNPPIVPFNRLMAAAATHLCKLRMAAVCRKYHELVHDEGVEFTETLSQFQGDAIRLKVTDESGSLRTGSNFETINQRIQWKQKNPGKLKGRSSGYERLDKVLDGLMPRYYIIGARPSVGKTAELCDINSAICKESGASIIFSLEMPADDIRERSLSSLSRVPLSGFRDLPYSISELESVTRAQNQMQKWKWWINDDPETSISDIEAQSMSLYRDNGKIDTIFVDYLQLIAMPGKKDRWEKVGEMSRRLKALGRNIGCAMIALSQLTRSEGIYHKESGRTRDKRPELSSLRESGNLEQDADVVQFIHRDIRTEPEKAEFIVAKHRGGPTEDSIPMCYNSQITSFSETQ